MKHRRFVSTCALIASLSLASITHAGVVYEIEVKDHDQSPPKTESIEAALEGRNLKMGLPSGSSASKHGTMIFRGDRGKKGEVILVDGANKTYIEMNDASQTAMRKRIGDAQDVARNAFKNIPPEVLAKLPKEQRDRLQKLENQFGVPGAAKPRPKPVIKKTAEQAIKNGYPCVKHEVFREGEKVRVLWITAWSNIEGGGESKDTFLRMGAYFDGLMKDLPEVPGAKNQVSGPVFGDEMNFESGFPVGSIQIGNDGKPTQESWLIKTRKSPIPPDAFDPPAGFKRQEAFGPQ